MPAFAKAQLLLVLLLLLRFAPLVARFPLWHVGCPSLLLVFGLCSLTHVAGGFSWRCVLFALFEEGCVASHDALPVGQPEKLWGWVVLVVGLEVDFNFLFGFLIVPA